MELVSQGIQAAKSGFMNGDSIELFDKQGRKPAHAVALTRSYLCE